MLLPTQQMSRALKLSSLAFCVSNIMRAACGNRSKGPFTSESTPEQVRSTRELLAEHIRNKPVLTLITQ